MSSEYSREAILLGKLLGEMYRLQMHVGEGICNRTRARVYGLVNGFDSELADELRQKRITEAQLSHAVNVLDVFHSDASKLAELSGFYEIEGALAAGDVSRSDAIRIFTYLKLQDRFLGVLEKMNAAASPIECMTFEVRPDEL